MAKVKVWNDNVHDHTETFKGRKITIPAKQFVEMDWEEAVELKGQFTPMAPADAPEREKSKFYKMIRIEGSATVQPEALVCHADGTKAESLEELNAKLARFESRLARDPELDRASPSNASAEIAALQKQVADLMTVVSAFTEKRSVGRPKKAASA